MYLKRSYKTIVKFVAENSKKGSMMFYIKARIKIMEFEDFKNGHIYGLEDDQNDQRNILRIRFSNNRFRHFHENVGKSGF